jgi:tetratricopeptide (TPR) repeat protein
MTEWKSVPAVLFALWALLIAQPAIAQSPAPGARETLLIPFENTHADPGLFWLGEASALLLSDYFEAFGAATVPRDARAAAFDRLQLPPAAALSHATVIKVAQFVGASNIVVGTYELTGEQLTVRARTIELDPGRLVPEVVEAGPLHDLFAIYERLARRLLDTPTATPAAPEGTIMASPQALEFYVKGLMAETPETQRTVLEQALKIAPKDDRVRLALWQVYTDLGEHLKALDSVADIAGRYSREAQYLAARSNIELKRYDQAFDLLSTMAGEQRTAEIVNALGVVQLLRGDTAQSGKPVYYFSQATQADESDPDYFFNLGYAYWIDRDLPAAVYWLREALRRDPTDGDAHYVLGAALQQNGASEEAAREKELARRLSSTYAEWERRAAAGGDVVPRNLHRMKERLGHRVASVDWIITSSGQRDQAEVAAFHLDAARRAFEREADREAEQELRRAVFLSPYLAEAHLLLGRVYLRGGRATEAIEELKVALWSAENVVTHLALAEAYLQLKDFTAATAEVDRALLLEPDSAEAKALRDRILRAKM